MQKRILIVDDDDDIRMLSTMSLSRVAGHDVRAVGSGQECLDQLASWTPDLVLLDVMMPGMDGISTLAAIRSGHHCPDVPVAFLTASVAPTEVDRLAALAVLGVLGKPFDPMQLPAQVAVLAGW
ncbi:MAG: response regulator [Actinobacteria bacterium]|jgi:CheY-like chemotaxis protein|nr:response regulator [Actinomycetota bacterium]